MTNPNNAIRNADSHEYFAENTPALFMPFYDIQVSGIELSEQELRVNSDFSISFVLNNTGNVASLGGKASIMLSEDSDISRTDTVYQEVSPVYAPASTMTNFTVVVKTPSRSGVYYFGVCADSFNGEVDTSNNCSSPVGVKVVSDSFLPSVLRILLDD